MPLLLALCLLLTFALPATAQVVRAPYDASYTVADLGTPAGVPGPLGGLTFLPGDPDTIVIGGAANGAGGALYALSVVRGAGGHITGFDGAATRFADGAYNDGGVTFGPGGVLFLAQYPINGLAQLRPGSTTIDRTTDLTQLGVASSVGAIAFVPPGFPGAGQAKIVSYNAYRWYTLALAAAGDGTWDVTAATYSVTTTGGPEGFIYVPQGSPHFPSPSMLVSEYQAGMVTAFEVDANGDPRPETRVVFVDGLSGAEGAVIDPVTGDFLFSTFGGGNHVVAVRGFVPPPSTSSTSSTTTTTTSSTTSSTTTTTAPVPCETAVTCDDADVCNGTETCAIGFCAPAAAAQCRPAGRAIAAVSLYRADALALLDASTRETIATMPVGHQPWGVAWQPDGARVWVTNRGGGSLTAVDPRDGGTTTVSIGDQPLGVAVHGTRAWVAAHGDDEVVAVDTAAVAVVDRLRVGDGPAGVVVNGAGTRLYVGNYRAGTVTVLDAADGTTRATIDVGGFPLGMALSADGATLWVADYGGSRVVLIGTASDTVTGVVRVGRRPIGVALAADGTRAWVTCAGDDAVAVVDAAAKRVVARTPTARLPLGVAVDSAGEVWVASSNGGALAVLSATGDVAGSRALDGAPVAFGQFVGALPGDCPPQALACDDADPFTQDGCDGRAGCTHAELDGLEAAAAGTDAMAELLAGLTPGGALGARVLATVPALDGSIAAARVGGDRAALRAVRRDLSRLAKLVAAAARRGELGAVGPRVLDVARAARARLAPTR
jgi:YVTN family beta-propeller protein